jgi:hypothetical protein
MSYGFPVNNDLTRGCFVATAFQLHVRSAMGKVQILEKKGSIMRQYISYS